MTVDQFNGTMQWAVPLVSGACLGGVAFAAQWISMRSLVLAVHKRVDELRKEVRWMREILISKGHLPPGSEP